MKSLFLLLLFCHVSSPVKHSLKFLFTGSSGIQNLPELVIVALVDDVQAGYCNSNKTIEIHQEVWKKLFKDNPGLMELFTPQCFEIQPIYFKSTLDRTMQHFNQTEGVHILQYMESCESDEQTGNTYLVEGGYDGEDFISFNVTKRKSTSRKPEADVIKQELEADKELPSVSVLQKSPSSPISCHATGFYPDRAAMFWRKDGQELHEDVDHGEILPNHDGTFQMRVDLKLSSVKPEDWRRYDCLFQLYGVEKNIITKLHKAVIRTKSVSPVGAVVGVVVGLMLLSVCITGLFIWRKKNKGEKQLID